MVAGDSAALFVLPLDRVFVDLHFNVRIFYGDIDRLAVSLMTEGQREPIKVRRDGDRFIVVDGHRRHRAFGRARRLSIVVQNGKPMVCEAGRPLGPAPGPAHPQFDPERVLCRLVDETAEEAVFASQLAYNSGKPFTLLERMIFVSRLCRLDGALTRDQLAAKTGFSRTYIANAQQLHSADPRLLDFVQDGRVSQKLALRLLRTFSADQQMARIAAAAVDARKRNREKILPKDIDWSSGDGATAAAEPADRAAAPAEASPAPDGTSSGEDAPLDAVRQRMAGIVRRLDGAERFAPNPAAAERLGTLRLVHQYAFGKLSYARLEAHLLGRE